MRKVIILSFLIFSVFIETNAQTGGYLGKKHHLSIAGDFHPLVFLIDYIADKDLVGRNLSFSLRPSYEYVFGKSFSMSIDAGFMNYSGGEIETTTTETGSVLFVNPTNTTTTTTTSSSLIPKYYVSGFDVKLKFNIYNYRTSGMIAPIGSYFSFLITRPFYNTSFSETAVFEYRNVGFGLEVGKRSILAGFVTIDYGLSATFTATEGTNTFKGEDSELSAFTGYYQSRQAENDYRYMQGFSIYLKFGYLL
jgi:hypothetical protein